VNLVAQLIRTRVTAAGRSETYMVYDPDEYRRVGFAEITVTVPDHLTPGAKDSYREAEIARGYREAMRAFCT